MDNKYVLECQLFIIDNIAYFLFMINEYVWQKCDFVESCAWVNCASKYIVEILHAILQFILLNCRHFTQCDMIQT